MVRTAVIVLLSASLIVGCSKRSPCEDDIGAFVIAQRFVTERLRSPSTADFPSIHDAGVSSTPTVSSSGQCAFNVRLYVDAQNGFGGTVRQNFTVEVAPQMPDGDSWQLLNIQNY